jgi:outer membrane protein TolC
MIPTAGNLSVSLNDLFDFSMVDPEQGGSSDSVTQNPELNLQLNQPVFVNGRFIDMRLFDATQRISEIAFQAQQNRTMGTVNQRIATVAQFYVQILNLRDQVEAIRAASDATRLQLEQTRIGQEQGRTSEQQVLSIQVSLNSQQEQLLNLQYSISEAESTLARAVGLPLSEVEGSFTTLPDVELPSGDAAELAQRAVEQNPQLRSLRLQQERARLQRIQAGREGAPGLQLSFSLQPRYGDERSSDEDFGSAFSDYGNDGGGVDWNARIGLRIPLTEQTERGLRKEERALGVEQIGLDIDSLQQNVESSIENRLRRDQVLARRIELLQSDVDLQRRRLENERRRVELDTSTELDLRRLEAELVRKQNAVKQAERERFLNAVQLYSTLGAELDAVLSGSE